MEKICRKAKDSATEVCKGDCESFLRGEEEKGRINTDEGVDELKVEACFSISRTKGTNLEIDD
jgi:hypothetical protein